MHRLNVFLVFCLVPQSCLQRPRTDMTRNINRRFFSEPVLFHTTQVQINYNPGGWGAINRHQFAHLLSILMRGARACIIFQILYAFKCSIKKNMKLEEALHLSLTINLIKWFYSLNLSCRPFWSNKITIARNLYIWCYVFIQKVILPMDLSSKFHLYTHKS